MYDTTVSRSHRLSGEIREWNILLKYISQMYLFLIILFTACFQTTFAKCQDWYQSTLECEEYRKILRADSSQNICRENIQQLAINSTDINKLQKVSFCLRHVAPTHKLPTYIHLLKNKLPEKESWFFNKLKQYRIHKELESASTLAWLAEIRFPHSTTLRQELTEIYKLNADFILAGKSYLNWLNIEETNKQFIFFSLSQLIQTVKTELNASEFLDSLIYGYSPHSTLSSSVLGELCRKYNHASGVLQCYRSQQAISHQLPWKETQTILRYFSDNNHWDYMLSVLKLTDWKKSKDLNTENYRTYEKFFLKASFHLKKWSNIVGILSPGNDWHHLDWEAQLHFSLSCIRYRQVSEDRIQSLRKTARKILQHIRKNAPDPWQYRSILAKTELLIAENKFIEAKGLLQKEKDNPGRKESSSALLYWRAIINLFEQHYKKADSLLVLAGAYTTEESAGRALEIRYWLMLDSSGAHRKHFFNALPESPFGYHEKIYFLSKIPESSPLWPWGRLESATFIWKTGKPDSAVILLDSINKRYPNTWIGIKAKALQTYLRESDQTVDSSLANYDEILLQYQQGVIPEFSRERIRQIKEKH
ncbi:MAG: hypothetical protein HQK83_03930 [Fibrobacteria bacterium]|nr:hypothetical protein [Fibrobacteria bacterium]